MGIVRIRIPPFLASMLDAPGADWLVLEHEIGEETTIGDVLAELACSYAKFTKVIYNPDVAQVGDQVTVILNDSLLQPDELARTNLGDGDTIVLLPAYTGGQR